MDGWKNMKEGNFHFINRSVLVVTRLHGTYIYAGGLCTLKFFK
jgi:hypothetical protein